MEADEILSREASLAIALDSRVTHVVVPPV
jgi:hypothetical protein